MPERKKRIMIVNDDSEVLSSLELELEDAGYAVTPFLSGSAALANIDAVAPDLLILDERMPDLTGEAVAKAIRFDPQYEKFSSVHIIRLDPFDSYIPHYWDMRFSMPWSDTLVAYIEAYFDQCNSGHRDALATQFDLFDEDGRARRFAITVESHTRHRIFIDGHSRFGQSTYPYVRPANVTSALDDTFSDVAALLLRPNGDDLVVARAHRNVMLPNPRRPDVFYKEKGLYYFINDPGADILNVFGGACETPGWFLFHDGEPYYVRHNQRIAAERKSNVPLFGAPFDHFQEILVLEDEVFAIARKGDDRYRIYNAAGVEQKLFNAPFDEMPRAYPTDSHSSPVVVGLKDGQLRVYNVDGEDVSDAHRYLSRLDGCQVKPENGELKQTFTPREHVLYYQQNRLAERLAIWRPQSGAPMAVYDAGVYCLEV